MRNLVEIPSSPKGYPSNSHDGGAGPIGTDDQVVPPQGVITEGSEKKTKKKAAKKSKNKQLQAGKKPKSNKKVKEGESGIGKEDNSQGGLRRRK